MKILGIDPGLASTGIGVIQQQGEAWRCLECDDVRTTSARKLPARLRAIYDLVAGAVESHRPDAAAIEAVFFAKNVRSAVMMAHGRGAAILALANADVPLFEYSPLEIKQSVVGYGRASKDQVEHMVKLLLGMSEPPGSDHQADALACALAHAYRREAPAVAESAAGPGENRLAALYAEAKRAQRGKKRSWTSRS